MAKKNSRERGGRKVKRNQDLSFSGYVYRVMKQIHPDVSISKNAMKIVSCFLNDIFEKISA